MSQSGQDLNKLVLTIAAVTRGKEMMNLKLKDPSGNEIKLDENSIVYFKDETGCIVSYFPSQVTAVDNSQDTETKLITFKDFFGQEVSNINFK